jgi:hypothetical protein
VPILIVLPSPDLFDGFDDQSGMDAAVAGSVDQHFCEGNGALGASRPVIP